MTIYMMRHGKTRANIEKYYATNDEPILPIAPEIIERSVRGAEERDFKSIVTSPYLRTRQTAKLVAGVLNLPVTIDEEIHEINLGVLEGKTFKEAYALYGDALEPWIDDPFINGPPEGESLYEVYRRAENFLSTAQEDTLYMSHDGFIRAVLCAEQGDIHLFFDHKIDNLEIIKVK